MSKNKWTKLVAVSLFLSPLGYADECQVLKQRYIHQYGIEINKKQWMETGQTGHIVTTQKNGVTCKKHYLCGLLEGQTTYTFPNSEDIEKVKLYSQNQLLKETNFYLSGSPFKEITYSPTELILVREWYENGSLKSFEKYSGSLLAHGVYYDTFGQCVSKVEDGKGVRTLRDIYGSLVSTNTLKEGKVEVVTLYYENGVPKEVNPYVGGAIHGLRKTFLPGGEPYTIENWEHNKLQGVTTLYIDGERAQEIPYVNGLREGQGRIYKDGEFVVQELNWKNDRLHGPCKTYLEDKVVTEWYWKGNKVSQTYYEANS